jgi:hypothetical protein
MFETVLAIFARHAYVSGASCRGRGVFLEHSGFSSTRDRVLP